MVTTDGIVRNDGVHYDAWGYIRLAWRFGRTIEVLR
jgi:hypothetical protein